MSPPRQHPPGQGAALMVACAEYLVRKSHFEARWVRQGDLRTQHTGYMSCQFRYAQSPNGTCVWFLELLPGSDGRTKVQCSSNRARYIHTMTGRPWRVTGDFSDHAYQAPLPHFRCPVTYARLFLANDGQRGSGRRIDWTYGPHTLSFYLSNLLVTHLFLNSQSSSITESTPIPTVPDTIEAPPATTQG